MTLSYDHLFSDIGEMIEAIDDIYTIAATTLPAIADEIEDELIDETDKGDGLTPAARYDILSGIPEIFIRFQDTAIGWIGQLAAKVEQSLTDVDILSETDLPLDRSASAEDVMKELYRKMIDDTETVDASTVQIAGADQNAGAATADANNQGNGKVFVTRILDGYSEPASGAPSLRQYTYDRANSLWPGGGAAYVGEESQLAVASETMTLTCESDSETDGLAEGGESFGIIGGLAGRSDYDWETEGSGRGSSISVMNQSGLVTDGEFENFTTNDPDSWTIDNGSAGTHIFEETVNMHRGSACLKYSGDGAQATIQVSQDASASLIPLKRYCVACWVKGMAGIAAGTLTIQFEGTGYTAPTVEKISMNAAALAAQVAFGEEYFFVNMPAEIPDDFELVVKITGTLTNAKDVLIDGLALGEVAWHGGVGWAILAGSNPLLRGDRFTCTITNDNAGTFQKFFRKHFKMQLPSNSAAGETIDDAWAE
jgi:hypothetical protein